MKERLTTAAGALLILAVVYGLLFEPPAEPPVTRPVSTEGGRNGYLAISHWLSGQGIPVASLRERFDRLIYDDAAFAARGNVLLTTVPYVNPLRLDEQRSLERWIAAGNTLLVMAALDDTPEWSVGATSAQIFGELSALAGLRFEIGSARLTNRDAQATPGRAAPPPRSVPIAAETPIELEAVGAHPLMTGVESLRGFSDEESLIWQAASIDPGRPLLRLGVERNSGVDALWETARGEGQIIVIASGSLLTNHVVADSDAGRLLANLIRYHLGRGGSVIFDDMHQGLSVIYDADAFFADPRLHETIWFLLAGWLIYLLGSSNRFGPPKPAREAPRQADFLEAVAGFMARRLDRRDAGLALFEEWFDDIRRSRALPGGAQPPWAALAATPALGPRTLDRLRRFHGRLTAGRAVDLVRLHNVLRQARKAIG